MPTAHKCLEGIGRHQLRRAKWDDAPMCNTNVSDTSIYKIQRAQNEALRIITGSHKISSIDHLYSETKMPHLICQHSHRQHGGQQIIKQSTPTHQWRGNISDDTTTGHSVTDPFRPLHVLELLQKKNKAEWFFKLSRLRMFLTCSTALHPPHRFEQTWLEQSFVDPENLE